MVNQSLPDLTTPKWTRRLLAVALIASLIMAILALSPDLWDSYRVVNDVQNSYWMARYQDPSLFATDYLLGRHLIDINILGLRLVLYTLSPGWGLLFYLASFVIDHIWLSKWSVFILMPLCVIYLFKLGHLLGGNLTALSLSLLFAFFILASPQSLSIASGLQRGFAVPMLIVFLYYLINKKYVGAGLMIFISALIYIPNFFLATLAYSLSFVKIEYPFRVSLTITRSKLVPLVGGVLSSALIVILLLAVQYRWFASFSTPFDSGAVASPPLYFGFPWLGRAGLFDTGADMINFLILLIFGALIYKIVGPQSLRRMPSAGWYLLASGLIMYLAALFFIFQRWYSFDLYYPSRYARSVLFVVAFLFVGLNWVDFWDKIPNWVRQKASTLIFFVVSLILALIAIHIFAPSQFPVLPLLLLIGLLASGILVLLGWGGLYLLLCKVRKSGKPLSRSVRGVGLLVVSLTMIVLGSVYINTLGLKTINPSVSARNIYEFVGSLPKDVLLAGDPKIMTDIPLFSERSVLFTNLLVGGSNAAILDFFDAQYAESHDTILDFCQHYDVSYLVLNRETFTSDYLAKGDFYFQPHNDKIVEMVTGRSDFVLPQLEPVFASGPLAVIKCDVETLLADN